MSIKSQMAAMAYLAKVRPDKYDLKHVTKTDDGTKITLSMVKYHPVEGFAMWQVIHTIWPDQDNTWSELVGWL